MDFQAFDPNSIRINPEEIEERIADGREVFQKAFERSITDYDVDWSKGGSRSYFDEFDEDTLESLRITEDYARNFIDGVKGYNPSMELAMAIIDISKVGAHAIGFLDPDDKVIDENGNKLTGYEAIKYCVAHNELPIDKIADLLSLKLAVGKQELIKILSGEMEPPAIEELYKRDYAEIAYFTSLIGLPIQALFNYKFYSKCYEIMTLI